MYYMPGAQRPSQSALFRILSQVMSRITRQQSNESSENSSETQGTSNILLTRFWLFFSDFRFDVDMPDSINSTDDSASSSASPSARAGTDTFGEGESTTTDDQQNPIDSEDDLVQPRFLLFVLGEHSDDFNESNEDEAFHRLMNYLYEQADHRGPQPASEKVIN